MFICWMDRIVWFILMMVFSNLLVEITGVPSKKVINVTSEQKDLQKDFSSHLNEISKSRDVEIIEKENFVESMTIPTTVKTKLNSKVEIDDKGEIISTEQQQTIFDSIFNIPISTLKAVNTLVQVILGTIQNPGGQTTSGPPQINQGQQITQQKIKYKHQNTKELNLTMLSL